MKTIKQHRVFGRIIDKTEGTDIRKKEVSEVPRNIFDIIDKCEKELSGKSIGDIKCFDWRDIRFQSLCQKLDAIERKKQTEAWNKLSNAEKEYYLDIVNREPIITRDVMTAARDAGGRLEGLNYRIKSLSSTYEKIHMRKNENLDKINDNRDIIRYTEVFPSDTLVHGIKKSIEELEKKGYTVTRVRNTWLDESPTYRGVNVNLNDAQGQSFEIQFHTPESYDLKNGELHKLYERRRMLADDSPGAILIDDKMQSLSGQLAKPRSIMEVKNR